MLSGQELGIFGEMAEIASSDIAEDYPKTNMLANEVTRCRSERENGTLAKDKYLERQLILEKYSLARDVA